ncbi:F-box domain-containing protein [Mycena chlorophos]|uniref:F-box domain-containing protein n=1 Tax=Mycena chlorophos TaxID=658473 RepID=A0A8H6VVA5_MYCCL|nr:F-box domain-containing protein [Mycena chlorophos]
MSHESSSAHLIDTLPADILGQIFSLYAACDPKTDWFGLDYSRSKDWNPATDPAWQITRVCAAWRDFALATPLLWRTLSISGEVLYSLESLRGLLGLQLARSAQTPLIIDLGASWRESTAGSRAVILEVLIGEAHRWEDVKLKLNQDDLQLLAAMSSDLVFPQLKQLALAVEVNDLLDNGFTPPFRNMPLLQKLGLRAIPAPSPLEHLPWSQITSFVITWPMSLLARVEDFFAMLRSVAPTVVDLAIHGCGFRTRDLSRVGNELIILPRLESLTLVFAETFYLHRLAMPALQNFCIRGFSGPARADGFLNGPTRPSVTRFSFLSLDATPKISAMLLATLRCLPSLRSLVLGVVSEGPIITEDFLSPGLLKVLECGPGEANLIPDLEELELRGQFATASGLSSFIKMLQSRCLPQGCLHTVDCTELEGSDTANQEIQKAVLPIKCII